MVIFARAKNTGKIPRLTDSRDPHDGRNPKNASLKRDGKREYLKDAETSRMMKELDEFFLSRVEIPAMRHGNSQAVETLISEEALLLSKYLRNEINNWIPRIAIV